MNVLTSDGTSETGLDSLVLGNVLGSKLGIDEASMDTGAVAAGEAYFALVEAFGLVVPLTEHAARATPEAANPTYSAQGGNVLGA